MDLRMVRSCMDDVTAQDLELQQAGLGEPSPSDFQARIRYRHDMLRFPSLDPRTCLMSNLMESGEAKC